MLSCFRDGHPYSNYTDPCTHCVAVNCEHTLNNIRQRRSRRRRRINHISFPEPINQALRQMTRTVRGPRVLVGSRVLIVGLRVIILVLRVVFVVSRVLMVVLPVLIMVSRILIVG